MHRLFVFDNHELHFRLSYDQLDLVNRLFAGSESSLQQHISSEQYGYSGIGVCFVLFDRSEFRPQLIAKLNKPRIDPWSFHPAFLFMYILSYF